MNGTQTRSPSTAAMVGSAFDQELGLVAYLYLSMS